MSACAPSDGAHPTNLTAVPETDPPPQFTLTVPSIVKFGIGLCVADPPSHTFPFICEVDPPVAFALMRAPEAKPPCDWINAEVSNGPATLIVPALVPLT